MLRRVDRELEEADEIVCGRVASVNGQANAGTRRQIAQMEIEMQTAGREQKSQLQSKVRQHKATLNGHKAEMVSGGHSLTAIAPLLILTLPEQKTLASSADRDDLLSSSAVRHTSIDMDRGESPTPSHGQAQRSRLLSATDKLSDGQRRLEDSHRVALETEDLGAGILRDLRGQRDQLEHTRDTVKKMCRSLPDPRLTRAIATAVRSGRVD